MISSRVGYEVLKNECRLCSDKTVLVPNDEKCKSLRSGAMLSCIDCYARNDRRK